MAELQATFRKPFTEQAAAFRLRLGDLVATSRWDDITHEQHDRAFMVAGAVKADLLADLAVAVDKAITEGKGLEAFRRDFRDIVERRGWHGWTGEGSEKGEAWRTNVIYRTNMLTSYAAGRHAQLKDGDFPFWVYAHSGAENPRLHHLAWDGLVLRSDHSFWKTHYPPNGWFCGCRVRGARSLAGAQRVGGDPAKRLPEDWDDISPETGVQVGLQEGWDYAPGASVSNEIAYAARKSVNWDYHLAKAFMQSIPLRYQTELPRAYRDLPSTLDALTTWAKAVKEKRATQPLKTLGLLTPKDRTVLAEIIGLRPDGFDWVIDQNAMRHVYSSHGDLAKEALRGQKPVTPSSVSLLATLLNSYESVEDGGAHPILGQTVKYSALIGTERVTAVFAVARKRQRLNLVTMYVR